jgi:hypothetical protein
MGPTVSGTGASSSACQAWTSFFTLKGSPPSGQRSNPMATTSIRSASDGSNRSAEAISVAEPITRTASRS